MVGKNKAAGEFVMLNHSFFEVNFVGVTKKKQYLRNTKQKVEKSGSISRQMIKSDSVAYADPTFFLIVYGI